MTQVQQVTEDSFGTIQGRSIKKVECPECGRSIKTTPKLAKQIEERGCAKCLSKKAENVHGKPIPAGFKKLSNGYKIRGSAFSRRARLVDIYAAKLMIQQDTDGLWYVVQRETRKEDS